MNTSATQVQRWLQAEMYETESGMLRVHGAVQRCWLARSRTGNVRSDLTFRQQPNIVVLCVPSKRGYSVEAF